MKGPKGIKYVSLADSAGYGIAARRYLLALSTTGIPLTWSPMVHGMAWGLGYQPFEGRSIGDPELDSFCNLGIEYDTVILHLVPEYYPRWIRREQGKKIVAYTVWETDKIPNHWPPLLNAVDGLMVPCNWNKEVFKECGVTTPIWVIPHICKARSEPINSQRRWGIRSKDYLFYSINAWSERKANSKLIEAFLRAFTSGDKVTLLIKTGFRDGTRFKPGSFWRYFQSLFLDNVPMRVYALRRKYPSPARIKLITRHLKDQDVRFIHQRGDCYVSLCRGEGWGLGAFDAAAAGNPVIMTGYGGQLDYLSPDLAYLVDFSLVPVRSRLYSYTRDQNWAEASVEHAAQLMRRVFENQEIASTKGVQLKAVIDTNFNKSVIAKRLMGALSQVYL